MRSILITGASSGIGKALALESAKKGFRPILVARNHARLEDISKKIQQDHKIHAPVIVCDLAKKEAVEMLIERLHQESLKPDIVVNNAGFGMFGALSEMDKDQIYDMIAVNVRAVTHLTQYAAAYMKERGSGHIVNIASTAAFQPGPFMAAYFASKSYVLSLSIAVNEELAGSGVYVHSICPGPTATNFAARASETSPTEIPLFKKNIVGPDNVVQAIFKAIEEKKPLTIVGIKNNIVTFLNKFAPIAFSAKVTKKIITK